jgi:hypothetical protein
MNDVIWRRLGTWFLLGLEFALATDRICEIVWRGVASGFSRKINGGGGRACNSNLGRSSETYISINM